jgi:hypothetical protein
MSLPAATGAGKTLSFWIALLLLTITKLQAFFEEMMRGARLDLAVALT